MKDTDFEMLMESVREAVQIKRGEINPARESVYTEPEARTLREQLALSQSEFARLMGVSVRTLQNWEQGRRKPEGAARALLRVTAQNPKAVMDALL
jgi:putative transcriptional regulator